jgi:hypothetical protein
MDRCRYVSVAFQCYPLGIPNLDICIPEYAADTPDAGNAQHLGILFVLFIFVFFLQHGVERIFIYFLALHAARVARMSNKHRKDITSVHFCSMSGCHKTSLSPPPSFPASGFKGITLERC